LLCAPSGFTNPTLFPPRPRVEPNFGSKLPCVFAPSAFIAFRRDKLHDILRVQKLGKNHGGYHGETIDIHAVLRNVKAAALAHGWTSELFYQTGGLELFALHRAPLSPRTSHSALRIYISAGIHGDEPEGVHAIIQFIQLLEAHPELATGYYLSFYPVCNPTGFEDGTRHSRGGKDLNREFWSNSTEPEVRLLQAELQSRSFQGLISLHTDDTSDGFYGFVSGATLTKSLIKPALAAAEKLLPRDERPVIDGFAARNGVISSGYEGILSAPPKVRPRPFEIILETPVTPPEYLKQAAFVAALQTILLEYNKFIAYAPNL